MTNVLKLPELQKNVRMPNWAESTISRHWHIPRTSIQFHIAMRVSGNQYYYGMPMHASLDDFEETYRNVFRQFGLGVKTGVDFPVESVGNIGTGTSPGLLFRLCDGPI